MERPIPIPCALDREFWQAASEGRLVVQRTPRGTWQSYPRAHCTDDPMARDAAPRFEPVSGLGRIETVSVVHRSFYKDIPAPYAFAVIRLDEGAQLTAQVLSDDPASLAIGDRVEVAFLDLPDGAKLPVFRPVGAGAAP